MSFVHETRGFSARLRVLRAYYERRTRVQVYATGCWQRVPDDVVTTEQ